MNTDRMHRQVKLRREAVRPPSVLDRIDPALLPYLPLWQRLIVGAITEYNRRLQPTQEGARPC